MEYSYKVTTPSAVNLVVNALNKHEEFKIKARHIKDNFIGIELPEEMSPIDIFNLGSYIGTLEMWSITKHITGTY